MSRILVLLILLFGINFLFSQDWKSKRSNTHPSGLVYNYSGSEAGSNLAALTNFEQQYMEFEADATVDMEKMKNDVQAEIMAQSAAELRAYAQAAKFITGMLIKGVYVEKMGIAETENVGGKIEKTLVKHATVIDKSVNWTRGAPRGTVKIGILFKEQGGVLEMAIPVWREQAKSEGIESYFPKTDVQSTSDLNYTALIVDTKGLDIKPSICPLILSADGKKEIYGSQKVDTKYAIQQGIVGYHKSLENAKKDERVGLNPLIVKAEKSLLNNRSVAVSDENAIKIFSGDLKTHFLSGCKVVFIVD